MLGPRYQGISPSGFSPDGFLLLSFIIVTPPANIYSNLKKKKNQRESREGIEEVMLIRKEECKRTERQKGEEKGFFVCLFVFHR